MTLGDIIKKYRSDNQMSMDAFAEKSGISKAYISILEKNQHPKTGRPIAPSIQSIKQAADGMDMDFNALFGMLEGDVDLSSVLPPFSNISPIAQKSFPLYDGIAAGEPRLMPDGISLYVDATVDIQADFVLKVHGNSMIGARINDGDYVFVRSQPEVENGEIAAVAIGDEATLKRFYRYGDMIVLRGENPEFKELTFSGAELQQVRVLGKAIAFQSDIR